MSQAWRVTRRDAYFVYSMSMADYCEIRRTLSEQFALAARLYSEAVNNLAILRSVPPEEHKRLLTEVRKAQELSDRAATAYEEHVRLHGCSVFEKEHQRV